MADQHPRVHVTFGPSAAGSLKMALRTLGRTDEVLYLDDDLSLGPINPPDTQRRLQWSAEAFCVDLEPELRDCIDEFWTKVTTLPAGTEIGSDMFLFGRLLELIDDELVEGKNDQELWSMRESWVRLGPLGLSKRN